MTSPLSEHVAVFKTIGYDGFLRRYPHPMLLHIKQTFTDNQNIVGTVNFPTMLTQAAPSDVEVFEVFKPHNEGDPESISVGRSEECDICLPYKDISKRHATIQRMPGVDVYTVKDLSSRNGTSINGQLLTAETASKLDDGSDLAFARIHTCFMLPEGFAMLVKWAKLPM